MLDFLRMIIFNGTDTIFVNQHYYLALSGLFVSQLSMNWRLKDNLKDSNEISTHNYLVRKRILNHLTKLATCYCRLNLSSNVNEVIRAILSQCILFFTKRYCAHKNTHKQKSTNKTKIN